MDKYIEDLLFQYDCIIIPDFGGFVANYAAARIHPTQHTFYPPSKNIVFNKNLKNNDGLLANYIAKAENINYLKANENIKAFVEMCNKKLKNREKITIENVGVLYPDVEGNILFEPEKNVNYLIDSFGLTSFQSPAIKRENYSAKIEKQFKDRMPLPSQKKGIRVKKLLAFSSVVIAVLAITWMIAKTDIVKNVNYSNLNPFLENVTPEYKMRATSPKTLTKEDITNNDHASITDDTIMTIAAISLSNENSQLIPVRIKEEGQSGEQQEKQEKQHVSKTSAGNNPYHIIGGCFKILENAEKYVTQLQDENIHAAIIGQNNSGLYIVSYGGFPERQGAVEELARIKTTHNADAWLLKK